MSHSSDLRAQMQSALSGLQVQIAGDHGALVTVVSPAHLPAACRAIVERFEARLLTMVGSDERVGRGAYRLRYIFAIPGTQAVVEVICEVSAATRAFPSVTPFVPAASWYEREVQDLLGLIAAGHPDPRPLVLHGQWPPDYYPLHRDVPAAERPPSTGQPRAAEWTGGPDTVQVGALAAGIGEPALLCAALQGESMAEFEARLFYAHRGVEKICEGRSLDRAQEVVERICGSCSFANALAFCHAAEAIAGCQPPPRAEIWRAVFLELEHLRTYTADVGRLCAVADLQEMGERCERLQEGMAQLTRQLTGLRFPRGLILPGGLRRDLPAQAPDLIARTLAWFSGVWEGLDGPLRNDLRLRGRLRGIGTLSRDTAVQLGTVGITARAAGVLRDSRLEHPPITYLATPWVPVPKQGGDAEARLLARLDEVQYSLKLLQVVLDAVPGGPVQSRLELPAAGGHALGWAESARGEHVHWLAVDGYGMVRRLRVRAASYCNWPAVPEAMAGNRLEDLTLIEASFGLCIACVDR